MGVTADFWINGVNEVNGSVSILNVGEGDTKLSFDKNNPSERKRAAKIVTDMLKRGYALLVQIGEHNGEPVYQRVKAFDPETCEYIIASAADEAIDIGREVEPKAKRKPGRPRNVAIPAEHTQAVSVARTAGG